MSDPRHSPLPWSADGGFILDADGRPLGRMYDPVDYLPRNRPTEAECGANVALVVRAVNLFQELVRAVRLAEAILTNLEAANTTRDLLRKTIAKATK